MLDRLIKLKLAQLKLSKDCLEKGGLGEYERAMVEQDIKKINGYLTGCEHLLTNAYSSLNFAEAKLTVLRWMKGAGL